MIIVCLCIVMNCIIMVWISPYISLMEKCFVILREREDVTWSKYFSDLAVHWNSEVVLHVYHSAFSLFEIKVFIRGRSEIFNDVFVHGLVRSMTLSCLACNLIEIGSFLFFFSYEKFSFYLFEHC